MQDKMEEMKNDLSAAKDNSRCVGRAGHASVRAGLCKHRSCAGTRMGLGGHVARMVGPDTGAKGLDFVRNLWLSAGP